METVATPKTFKEVSAEIKASESKVKRMQNRRQKLLNDAETIRQDILALEKSTEESLHEYFASKKSDIESVTPAGVYESDETPDA